MRNAEPRLPAEWEPQAGVMLTWPHADTDWAERLDAVEPVFLAIATEIARRETVLINCPDAGLAERVRRLLLERGAPLSRIVTAIAPSDDTWARDHGPITRLRDAGPELLDFRFNGWGGKYPASRDDAITGRLHRAGVFGDTPRIPVDMVLEGGSIDSDGRGTLLTTRSCLLHPARNPHLDAVSVERRLRDLLGATRILWLQHGALEGDDTDGHIDMLARFVATDHIVYQHCDEPDYPAYASLRAMEAELRALRRADGTPYRLTPLPWPGAHQDARGQRLPASYANFLVINDAILVPAYDDARDAEAAARLQACFPQRTLVQIPCLPLIEQFGSLHCLTMQFPAGIEFDASIRG